MGQGTCDGTGQGRATISSSARTLLVGLAFGRLVVSGSAAGKSAKGRRAETNKMKVMVSGKQDRQPL